MFINAVHEKELLNAYKENSAANMKCHMTFKPSHLVCGQQRNKIVNWYNEQVSN